jgi:hypothetical protein
MLAPKPKPRPTRTFDPALESVREKVRATLRQLRGNVEKPVTDTDSAFFKIAKRTRMAQQAYTEEDLECAPASPPPPSDEALVPEDDALHA